MEVATWPRATVWNQPSYYKLLQTKIEPPLPQPDTTLNEFMGKSGKFPIKFPIESVRCQSLQSKFPPEILEDNIKSAYPLIHESALFLCASFLIHQSRFGPNRDMYQNMTLLDFIDRLLQKRAVAFFGADDRYLLLDGSRGSGNWESIGTAEEQPPLTLANCLSYDEIKLAAFLSVSSHTLFINDGNRHNVGIYEENRKSIQNDGVIIGLIGARLEKELVMEYREVIKSPRQNFHQYGYGQFFVPTWQGTLMNFYGDSSATFAEIKNLLANTQRFINLGNDKYFDRMVYARRLTISIDTLLIEANDRAEKLNTTAYVHVVGLGLGVWKITSEQDEIFMTTFAERLQYLQESLSNISDVCFSHIRHKMAAGFKHLDRIPMKKHPLGGIIVHMENREPHSKIDDGKLLVVSYAWDGNALPGNEFWMGYLSASGDPAAASSTQIAEIHNPHINDRVRARNLKIVTLNNGIVSFQQYQELHKNDQ